MSSFAILPRPRDTSISLYTREVSRRCTDLIEQPLVGVASRLRYALRLARAAKEPMM